MAQHRKLRKPIKAALVIGALALIAAGGWTAVKMHRKQEAQKEKQALYDAMVLNMESDSLKVDCGSETDIASLVSFSGGELRVEGDYDISTTGSYPLTLTITNRTSQNETVSRSFPITLEVIDATVPEIILKEEMLEISASEETADLSSNVDQVTDGKDGVLPLSESEQPGSYWITTDADFVSAGEYTAVVTALDLDGHRVEKEFRLVVNNAPENVNPYRISINRELNTVTVYALDSEGNYSIPLKAMVCSTGAATPVGVFHTFNRSEWRALFGGVYGQYATDIVGDILFHSVPYYSMNKGDVEYLEYNKLGTKASMGCIRLAVKDALWIFTNCPIGTEVEIYDDPSNPGPLGKPEPAYIDPESEIRGWDPTDPDPSNPYNN